MPSLTINTNVKNADVPADFLVNTSNLIAEMVGKPLKFVAVHLNADQNMAFGGTTEPCAIVNFNCIGKLGVEENISHTGKISSWLKETLDINPDRMYINFKDLQRSECGWNGTTFEGLKR